MKFRIALAAFALCAAIADAQCPDGFNCPATTSARFRARTVLRSNTFSAPSPQYVNYVAPPSAATTVTTTEYKLVAETVNVPKTTYRYVPTTSSVKQVAPLAAPTVAPLAAPPVSVKSTETYSCDSSSGPLARAVNRVREDKPVRTAAVTIVSLPFRVLARIFGR